MSQDNTVSRKDKKAQRDAERRVNKNKRKISEVDEQDETVEITKDGSEGNIAVESKKRKQPETDQDIPLDNRVTGAETTKPTKKRKANVKSKTDSTNENTEQAEPTTKSRFIVFIGNLPYNTTDASLQAHFKKLEPFTLRHRMDPIKKSRSKGFAFLEFDNYDRMKTCLKLYHHTMFDPDASENGGSGKGNGRGGRKINVELTSGGGGNAAGRKEKIKTKNVRLEEQRKRRAEAERKGAERKEKKSGANPQSAGEDTNVEVLENQDIHPSRLARIKG